MSELQILGVAMLGILAIYAAAAVVGILLLRRAWKEWREQK